MKISEGQLEAKLLNEETNVFIILGEEPLRIQELTKKIYNSLESRGYSSRDSHLVTPKMDWSFLSESEENLDLFSNKNIIEIGPGKVLSGLIKRINKEVKVLNIDALEDIQEINL